MPDYSDHDLIADSKLRYCSSPDAPNWRQQIGREYVKFSQRDRVSVREKIWAELNGAAPS